VRVVAATDKFRGTASAAEVAAAVARGVAALGGECDEAPVADGGEGTLAALGGPTRSTMVMGPLGDPVDAPWRMRKGTAVIEMALASGLALAGGATGNDPVAATCHGTGELIAAALDGGAERIIAPQKGATPAQVALLTRRLERLVDVYREDFGVDVAPLVGGGAAGGLAGGLAAVGGDLVSGFELVADELGLVERIEAAEVVVTGEGFLDDESFEGKVVGGVLALARRTDRPVLAVVGEVLDGVELPDGLHVVSLVERCGREAALEHTAAAIEEVVRAELAELVG
jgi:glycerate kinase